MRGAALTVDADYQLGPAVQGGLEDVGADIAGAAEDDHLFECRWVSVLGFSGVELGGSKGGESVRQSVRWPVVSVINRPLDQRGTTTTHPPPWCCC